MSNQKLLSIVFSLQLASVRGTSIGIVLNFILLLGMWDCVMGKDTVNLPCFLLILVRLPAKLHTLLVPF